MANLLDIYDNPTIANVSVFEQGLEGQAVVGTGASGIGLTNSTSNVYRPTAPSFQSITLLSGGPYNGTETYSEGGVGSGMTATGGGHF